MPMTFTLKSALAIVVIRAELVGPEFQNGGAFLGCGPLPAVVLHGLDLGWPNHLAPILLPCYDILTTLEI